MKVDGKFRISIFLKNNFKYFIFGLPIFIYLIAIINPFLNQSGELFGEFDFEFLTSFTADAGAQSILLYRKSETKDFT